MGIYYYLLLPVPVVYLFLPHKTIGIIRDERGEILNFIEFKIELDYNRSLRQVYHSYFYSLDEPCRIMTHASYNILIQVVSVEK